MFTSGVFVDANGTRLVYRLLEPPTNFGARPLLLFLHGAGERGDDNHAQLRHGGDVLATAGGEGCFVLAPQCPAARQWVNTPWAEGSYDAAQIPESAELAAVISLLQRLVRERPEHIDPARLYIMGISMGGYGVWDAIARHPGLFAAAVPICGGGDPRTVGRLRDLPIWAFHGTADATVPPSASRQMIAAMWADHQSPRYSEYADAGHDCWHRAWREAELWRWMFAQRRSLSLSPIQGR